MMRWDKIAEQAGIGGEKTIVYRAEGSACQIESRRRLIPHAARSGGWLHTSYFMIRPDGTEKEYWRLKDAQQAAEEEET